MSTKVAPSIFATWNLSHYIIHAPLKLSKVLLSWPQVIILKTSWNSSLDLSRPPRISRTFQTLFFCFTYLDMDLYSCHWHRLFPMYSHYWNGTHFDTDPWSLLQSYKLVRKDNLYLFCIPLDKPHCLIQFHFLFHKIHQLNNGHRKSRF